MADKRAKLASRKTKQNARDLTLEDVLAVGGDKDDFEMMKDVDISGDFVSNEEDASENINEKEIMSYIKELGLDKISFKGKEMKYSESAAKAGNIKDSLPKHEDIQEGGQSEKGKKGKKGKKLKSQGAEKGVESTGVVTTTPEPQVLPERKERPCQKLLIKPGGLWYDLVMEEKINYSSPSQADIAKLCKEAADLLENEVNIYDKMKAKEKSSDSEWLKSVVSSGTLSDKVAALTVQIQESAVHRLKTLDILISMAKKKGRRESIIAVDMLKELWMTLLLPNNRKLRKFVQNPLTSLVEVVHKGGGWVERDRRLILWHFEELLKQRYKEFIEVLEKLLQDTLVNIRSKMLGTVYDLLSEKPEQEQILLSLLVNKIGDPDRKVASKAVYLTRSLVTKHPNMKLVVTKEIEKLLYRPNIAIKAQYFAVCFLNQLILTKQDSELATRLISIYFSFFGAFLKKGDMEAKMLSALLTGVNRAFPYAKEEDEQYNNQINTLFRTVHIGTFNTSVQALMLLFQVMESRQSVSDRFYQALYTKLLDPSLKTSSKQAVFLNVLYKSLKSDPSLDRVKAFVKRILQVCSFQQPAFIGGTLFMISELTKVKPGIKSLTQQPEEDDDEEHFVDIPSDEENNNYNTPQDLSILGDESQAHHVDTPKDPATETNLCGTQRNQTYKPHQRNPLFSGAENSCLWELNKLSRHYHPSVCLFARTLMKGGDIEYKGDPLQDFTLMRFLDRFVYKNPKRKERDHGGSLMQPKTSSSRLAEEPVNTKAFLLKKEEDIREDELFFHRYFKQKAKKENKRKKKTNDSVDETSEMASNFDNIQEERSSEEFNFASELKSSKERGASENKHTASDEEDEGDDEEQSEDETDSEGEDMAGKEQNSSEEEFDYEAMDFSSTDDEEGEEPVTSQGKKRKPTERDYEKALLENLSSDEFSDDEGSQNPKKKSKKGEVEESDVSSMFASAEEFAHLLENSKASRGGSYDVKREGASDKQLKWEEKKAGRNWIRSSAGKFQGVTWWKL
ncbi:CCAAT/enhancer-binding protein zeta-like [Orbicella faveolata]|uniref:CCAAT/enhancer-binding protein zeta-like n=1 Tax=Orbicella faveolata TaxID=48498 RepID=UPI0009E4CAB3|nr:CCAAT/enhancer-binding protein zeta-like [Orbicella faveolata]